MNALAGAEATPGRSALLDGWRGLAILLVLEGHFFTWLPMESGRLGVDLFFALSGTLMGAILFVKRQSLPLFYARRASRILPAFVVFVAVIYAFAAARGMAFSHAEWVATVLFLRTYLPAEPGIWQTPIPIGHLWSLNVEEHAYLLMSLLVLLRLARGREGPVLLAAGLGCIGIGLVYARLGPAAPAWGPLGTEVAAAHIFLAAGYRVWRERLPAVVPAWAPVLAMALGMACYADAAPWWAQRLLSPLLLAFSVNHLDEAWVGLRWLLAGRPLRRLGLWSFSVYLWQQPLYAFKSQLPGGSMTGLAIALALGWLSFRVIEGPCRDWLNARAATRLGRGAVTMHLR